MSGPRETDTQSAAGRWMAQQGQTFHPRPRLAWVWFLVQRLSCRAALRPQKRWSRRQRRSRRKLFVTAGCCEIESMFYQYLHCKSDEHQSRAQGGIVLAMPHIKLARK